MLDNEREHARRETALKCFFVGEKFAQQERLAEPQDIYARNKIAGVAAANARLARALNRVAAQIQIEIRSVIFCELAKDNANQFARFW